MGGNAPNLISRFVNFCEPQIAIRPGGDAIGVIKRAESGEQTQLALERHTPDEAILSFDCFVP